jgi:hypothetical protein
VLLAVEMILRLRTDVNLRTNGAADPDMVRRYYRKKTTS